MARKLIRQWRVSKAEPSGLQVWFDPEVETVRLFSLDPLEKRGVDEIPEGDGRDDLELSIEQEVSREGLLPF